MRIDLLRTDTYRLLAGAFLCPTAGRLELLASDESARVLREAIALLPASTLTDVYLRPFQQAATANLAALADRLTVEFCRLFVGPYSLPCPPYGSVYVDGGQVMGPSAVEALSYYRQAGLRLTRGWREPPDHIALELDFMACLGSRYAAAIDGGKPDEARQVLEVQRGFLRNYLGRWGPTFAERLQGAARSHLYGFLGEFLPPWLAFDGDLLDALAEAAPGIRVTC